MTPQELLNKHLQLEIGRLVMEIAVLKTNADVSEQAQKSLSADEACGGGGVNGAQSADGSRTE